MTYHEIGEPGHGNLLAWDSMRPRCPRAAAKFTGPDGAKWRVYHVDRRERPDLFDVELDHGAKAIGITHFVGPHKGKIFIDAQRSHKLKFEVTVHEIAHVILRDLGLNGVIEESFVDEFAARMAAILEQL